MPFDFRMKHEGEPPARLVAQLRMRLKEVGLPPRMADFIAPVMESEDDLDDDMLIQIEGLVRKLEEENVTREEADTALREVISDLIAKAAEREDSEEDQDEDITAWYPKNREARSQPVNLAGRVVMRVRRNRNPNPVRIRNHAPRTDQFGRTMVNGQHPDVRMLTDYLAGRHDPRQPAPRLSEIAMFSARRSGQRPLNIAEGVRMAMHSTSDLPRILEDSMSNAVARRLEQTVPALLRASHLIHASTYHQGSLLGLSASGIPQEIAETGEIKHVTIDETGELKPVPRDFGSIFRISQKAIVNDDLGLLEQITEKMVAGANERLRRVLLEPLLVNAGAGHDVDGDVIPLRQKKSGALPVCPILPELEREMRTWEKRPGPFVLQDRGRNAGKPFTTNQLWKIFNEERANHPELEGAVWHGLRANACIRHRLEGKTALQISDMVGLSVEMVERYCRHADRKATAQATVREHRERQSEKNVKPLKNFQQNGR